MRLNSCFDFLLNRLRKKTKTAGELESGNLVKDISTDALAILRPMPEINCLPGNQPSREKGPPTQDYASYRQYDDYHWKMVVCDGVSNALFSQCAARNIGDFILDKDVTDFDSIIESADQIRGKVRSDLLELPYFREGLEHPEYKRRVQENLNNESSSTTVGVVDVRWHKNGGVADVWLIGNCAAFVINSCGHAKNNIYFSRSALTSNDFAGIDIWPSKEPPITLFPNPEEHPDRQQNVRISVPLEEGDTIVLTTDGLAAGIDEYLRRYSGNFAKMGVLQSALSDENLTLLRDEFEQERWIEDDDVSFVQMTIRSSAKVSRKE